MADVPEHRAEDAAFLATWHGVLGAGAMRALKEIQTILRLDYGGIDFGLNQNGDVLLFEANATMAILPPGQGAAMGLSSSRGREGLRRGLEDADG